MRYLRIKNWSEFQHYKDRNPPWIKLHRTLLDDYEFACLQDASKLHLMLIWLFASQCDGRVPDDPPFLMKKLGLSTKPDIKYLISHGFLLYDGDASNMLALDASNLRLETETETETESTLSGKPDVHPLNGKKAQAVEVLDFLNSETGKAYRPVEANLQVIAARLREGYTVADMRKVIVRKCSQWRGDEKMEMYLRPATLFNKTKLAQYSGELVVPT